MAKTTKKEAIELMVRRELNAVPQEWVRIVLEHEGYYTALPMWGTMWIVDRFVGEPCMEHSREMVASASDIDLNAIEDDTERARVAKAIETDDWTVIEQYVDEEMQGARCVLDTDGHPTALYVYEVADEYVIGVNGAGWDFYDGVWNKLYDLLGLKWHDTGEVEPKAATVKALKTALLTHRNANKQYDNWPDGNRLPFEAAERYVNGLDKEGE